MKSFQLFAIAAMLCFAMPAPAQDRPNDPKTAGRIFHSAVWSGRDVLVWGGGSEGQFFGHGLRIDPVAKTRTALADKGAPTGRWGHASVWTGREMIVWGGRSQFESENHSADGARYNPRTDSWKPMSDVKAPAARSQMAAVWTGEEMIVWGGYGNGAVAWDSGGRYNPRTDKWRPLAAEGEPEARVEMQHVWTGKELLVWGGITPDLKRTFRSGARYDPAADKWTPMASEAAAPDVWGAPAVWSGREMIVWGGSHRNGDDEVNAVVQTGGAYDPAANRWRALATDGAPAARFFHTSVWTGSRLIVWGGGDQNPPKHFDDGAEYDPVKDRWLALKWENGPSGRGNHSAVWTKRGMVVFGGSTGGFTAYADDFLLERR